MLLLSAVRLAGCPFGWQESGPIAGREKAELQWTHVKPPQWWWQIQDLTLTLTDGDGGAWPSPSLFHMQPGLG